MEDHDLLIELRTEMKEVRKDIKELKNTLLARVEDHEIRIRTLEKDKGKSSAKWLDKIISLVLAGVISYIIAKYNR